MPQKIFGNPFLAILRNYYLSGQVKNLKPQIMLVELLISSEY